MVGYLRISSLERKIATTENKKKKKNATDGNTCNNNVDEQPNQKIKIPLQASWLVT